MTKVTYDIDGRTITVANSQRKLHTFPRNHDKLWDIFDGETLLTTADPWMTFDGGPSPEQVRRYLQPRRQELQRLMTKYKIVDGPDYDYVDEYELLYGDDAECPRWVAVTKDETYHFFNITDDFRSACESLASSIGEATGGTIVGIYNLDDGKLTQVHSHTLVWARYEEEDASLGHYGPDFDLNIARHVVIVALEELDTAVRAVIRLKILRQYPRAVTLVAHGEYNDNGMLQLDAKRILDADGKILDDVENPSQWWDEVVDSKIDDLLHELSERDDSYQGDHKIDLT